MNIFEILQLARGCNYEELGRICDLIVAMARAATFDQRQCGCCNLEDMRRRLTHADWKEDA